MEVSSPTSSSSSAFSAPFPPPVDFSSSLPVMSMKERIVEKILENRVTLIVGETGSGKSSQVPQFLLEANMKPILCTQPRRFAVVAVAKMVAKARNCELGGEVGYHIGHSKLVSARSTIVFKTAGVLLDEMRDKGLNALNYKVIILDEVHERSVESDLVLSCVKQFLMKSNDLRVVLMSATADIGRYKDYFKDLGRGERVEVLAIPNTNQRALYQKKVSYLDQATACTWKTCSWKIRSLFYSNTNLNFLIQSDSLFHAFSFLSVTALLGIDSDQLDSRYSSGVSPSMASAKIKPELHQLIHDLVVHIHKNEPDIEKGILVFLPTYYDLERLWHLLKPLHSFFKVHILHRSIDTEQALKAMKILKYHRKVILATNIAESSVTIPKVAYVIDSCRSLQVFWDTARKKDSSELVWVSKSQAEQRRGRTGRTCDGHVYRLVTGPFFSKFDNYECPAILKLSLRQQVLTLCCAESRAINDPKVLLQKALDPPDPDVVEDALDLLVHVKALEKISSRGRYEPTFYGRLLASFALSFDASVLVLKFGDAGFLREGILLGIFMDIQPLPILRPFGEEHKYTEYACRYYGGDCNNTVKIGRKEMDNHRLEHLKQVLNFGEENATALTLPEIEEQWCSFHNLVQSSLHHVSEIYEDILKSLHLFRPGFLGTSDGIPTYYGSYGFEHTCLLASVSNRDVGTFSADDDLDEPSSEVTKCFAVPFVTSDHFQTTNVAKNFSDIIKEVRVQYAGGTHNQLDSGTDGGHVNGEASVCVYFVKGFCNRGSQCLYSHSLQAKRPSCKFFFSLQGCRNGESCSYSHDQTPSVSSSGIAPCLPEDDDVDAASLLQFFPISGDGCILLLDDTDLHFSSKIAQRYDPSKIISTTCLSETSMFDPSLTGVRILWGLHHPYDTIVPKAVENPIPWSKVKCVLWFPNLDGYGEDLERQKTVVQNFFEYLAVRILADSLYAVQVILTMNNINFSQLQVEKSARESFFFLRESFPFDEESFGELVNMVNTRKPMVSSMPISYVFDMHMPSELLSDNFGTMFNKHLNEVNGSISQDFERLCQL
ncbi:hypothetical protein Tsubulata_031721 [Turnera subulata]|uniref:RNA helicase n=1 Tax=Turnera subulata TaxID=218843 RepID=A0A9Q0J462_9ROSI|nr:hypothetical protein Tsubulata_031721 [Turnera subulata]